MSAPVSPLASFGDTAKGLAKNPLGIIALFIVLIYGFAALLLGMTADTLTDDMKLPLVWFLVVFPVMVLCVFTWLVAKHHAKLYGPGDFVDQKDFVEIQQQLASTRRQVSIMSELTPEIVLPQLTTGLPASAIPGGTLQVAAVSASFPDDPQRGRWGGKRESDHRAISVAPIRPLRSFPDNYRILIEVRSTDPADHPLAGTVRFHLHNTFSPDTQEVPVRDGVAHLTLAAYGAFTVGAETSDGARLELNLADPDIDAPEAFKER